MSAIDQLNSRFAIPGTCSITAGKNGMPRVSVTTEAATAEVYLHGAQLTSWCPAGGEEVIFLSEHSQWEAGRAIRGGIPICFPWFRNKLGDNQAPSHGFVRTRAWQLDGVETGADGVIVTLSTVPDASTKAWWPHDFHLTHRLRIGAELAQELVVSNTDSAPFTFEEALHTYYRVGSAAQVSIKGLGGVAYLDNTDENREKQQQGDIVFSAPTDRAYLDTGHTVEILDPLLGRRIRLTKESSRSTIVWNPWSAGAQAMADLGDEEWRSMACVEGGNIRAFAVDLAPGKQHTMRTVIQVSAM